MATQASGAKPWLTLNGVPLSFKRGDENLGAKATEYDWNSLRITPDAPDDLMIQVDDEILQTERYGFWTWRPAGFAGLYQLHVNAPGHNKKTALIRVLPSKFSHERYVQMLKDVSKFSLDLLLTLHSPAGEKAVLRASHANPSALREWELVRSLIDELAPIMKDIRRSPYRSLACRTEQRLLAKVHQFSGDVEPVVGPTWRLPDPIAKSLSMSELPAEWSVQESALTYDTYENRLLKHFLWRQLLSRIIRIQDRAGNEIKRRKHEREIKVRQGWVDDETPLIEDLTRIQKECQAVARQCMSWGSEPFLAGVGALGLAARPTQVLQKHPHYSRFFRLYLQFQQQLGVSLNVERYLTTLALHKMSHIYQVWSVFTLTDLIVATLQSAGFRVVSSKGFFTLMQEGFTVDVQPNASIELDREGLRVRIRYEPEYEAAMKVSSGLVSSLRSQLTPDLAVEVWEGNEARRVLIFDAKYGTEKVGTRHEYREKDRTKMDHYANSIRWKPQNPRAALRRVVSSAYILYPGDVLEHDRDYPEVGALPMLPKVPDTREIENTLHDLLRSARLIPGKRVTR